MFGFSVAPKCFAASRGDAAHLFPVPQSDLAHAQTKKSERNQGQFCLINVCLKASIRTEFPFLEPSRCAEDK